MRIFTALLLLAISLPAGARSILSRSMAMQHADESIQAARNAIGKDPALLDSYLLDTLAVPIGDDSRVLDLCGEVVKNATSAEEIRSAMQALEVISISHLRFFGRSKQKAFIAEYSGLAFDKGEFKTKERALATLVRLGGSYRDTAYRMAEELISKSAPDSENQKHLYVEAIRLLVNSGRKEHLVAIRNTTQTYGLIGYFKDAVSKTPSATVKTEDEKFLSRWARAIEAE